jgi:D-lyxose ketol-isomerase
MLRSRVNELLREGAAFIRQHGWHLPPFANWTPEAFQTLQAQGVIRAGLGWDITDYGAGEYDALGLFLFTLRNGVATDLGNPDGGMVYAEKLLISGDRQISPMHRHIVKTEDIINRGGAPLMLELYPSDDQGGIDRDGRVSVMCDGQRRDLSDPFLRLMPGESVTLTPQIWHAFWGDGGRVLIGEVSTVNDDRTDNIFEAPIGRFPEVVEDERAYRLLVSDYPEPQAQ